MTGRSCEMERLGKSKESTPCFSLARFSGTAFGFYFSGYELLNSIFLFSTLLFFIGFTNLLALMSHTYITSHLIYFLKKSL
ncbi:hypothetical protein BY996DRAFT_8209628 [Phakopsora pachyrhizi]|nr:hypothetical protein BY996DRAFT_8209628 [Phakopsora pachyrhizi]